MLNDAAPRNTPDVSFTLDTSHFEMSPLNDVAPLNISNMSLTAETFQFPIGPCGPLVQSPTGDCLRHAATAATNSGLSRGLNNGVVGMFSVGVEVRVVVVMAAAVVAPVEHIDPGEFLNMLSFRASE